MSRARRLARMPKRLIGAAFAIVLVVLVAPYGLVFLYARPSVHPVSTLMLSDLATGTGYTRDWVAFERIAPVLVQSVMMSEDGRFCAHEGVDWKALDTVIDGTMDGATNRGASTIPMQTAKNLFLWPSHSYVRKGLEIPLALYSDAVWSKRRLMEIYLNIAEFAPHLYGVEAAARHYFGTDAAHLTRRQAALLAVTLPNPPGRDPAHPSRMLQRLARTIETRARQSGAYITCLYP
ncbi:monofunctional biosynthetic peptidoglycan transglycosylase [Pararhizobium mangrovi]|uniref:Biosynthetic peptidoglycan transglycosylase n=1 Tax=Pararhizobium mangrovi TaxID=2590452 RepID=A0A506U8R5_9HYPH|nr:monofunctional biosynthetic peptidoglycan transglycosylase [Pararhizobium mangrovi]TPW30743.1 monofunctional biosynthetic peptidoglycan transglycosylase [Pararhizobium mangrovi]